MVKGNVAHALQDNILQRVEMVEPPLKFCTVTLSDVIASGKRLDAQKFDVDLKAAQAMILHNKFGVKHIIGSMDGMCMAYRPSICKRVFVEASDEAVAMFTPSQITDVYPKAEKYLSKIFCQSIPDWFVKHGEILLTCSGTVGNISLVSKTLDSKCISQNMIRIIPKENDDMGYIYAYLKSHVGQLFLTRNNYGAVIQHIDPEHLATVPIPDAPASIKKRINALIVGSYELRDTSNTLIDEATELLIKELQLPDIRDFDIALYKKNAGVDTFSVKLSDIAGRVDASYHVPIVDAIVDHMKQYAAEVTTVGDSRVSKDVILPPRFARVYVEEGYGRVLIGGKQIYELDPSGKKYLSKTKHKTLMEKLEVAQNTILITRSGTIGKIVLVPKHWEHWIPSDHIIRVVPASKDIAGYLSIFLASKYGYPLITHCTYGSVVDEINDTHVSSIPFPLLKNADMQRRINELALEANEKRYEAYKMEQQALQIIEKEVIFAK